MKINYFSLMLFFFLGITQMQAQFGNQIPTLDGDGPMDRRCTELVNV